jgi:hypothetical protein
LTHVGVLVEVAGAVDVGRVLRELAAEAEEVVQAELIAVDHATERVVVSSRPRDAGTVRLSERNR